VEFTLEKEMLQLSQLVTNGLADLLTNTNAAALTVEMSLNHLPRIYFYHTLRSPSTSTYVLSYT
jgi:hypothetical protein